MNNHGCARRGAHISPKQACCGRGLQLVTIAGKQLLVVTLVAKNALQKSCKLRILAKALKLVCIALAGLFFKSDMSWVSMLLISSL